jgi:uncharacterized protein
MIKLDTHKLIELEKLLSEIKGGKALNIVQLHGMLTALIIGPETVSPDDWLPYVFNAENELADFNSEDHLQKLVHLTLEFYKDIIHDLNKEGAFTFCIGGKTKDGKTDLDPFPWCDAFLDGTRFCREKYDRHLGDENSNLRYMLGPFYYFGDPTGKSDLEELCHVKGKEKEIEKGCLDSLPGAVKDIRDYWRKTKLLRPTHGMN